MLADFLDPSRESSGVQEVDSAAARDLYETLDAEAESRAKDSVAGASLSGLPDVQRWEDRLVNDLKTGRTQPELVQLLSQAYPLESAPEAAEPGLRDMMRLISMAGNGQVFSGLEKGRLGSLNKGQLADLLARHRDRAVQTLERTSSAEERRVVGNAHRTALVKAVSLADMLKDRGYSTVADNGTMVQFGSDVGNVDDMVGVANYDVDEEGGQSPSLVRELA